MGLQFDLETANWVAYLLEPRAPIPTFGSSNEQSDRLLAFLSTFSERFYSSKERESDLAGATRRIADQIREGGSDTKTIADAIEAIRNRFRERPWTALIVPSGDDPETDDYLCSAEFLRECLGSAIDFPGVVLQLVEPPKRQLVLNHIFPAFQAALSESSDWPGVLAWTGRREAGFFPFGTRVRREIIERARWLSRKLHDTPYPMYANLGDMIQLYKIAFPDPTRARAKLHLLQISDIHLGSAEAGLRITRTQQHIANLVEELRDGVIVPVVTGDLMDSPCDKNLDSYRLFLHFLEGLGISPTLAVLGNHDVRKDGWLQRMLGKALQIPTTHGVTWYDEAGVGVACFNSVVDGRWARGFVGERQRIDVANALDKRRDTRDFAIVGVLHHHPLPVDTPDWQAKPFYERFLGDSFERTEVLEDADAFVNYVEGIEMAAVLHGHKHIPRVCETPNARIPVFGCGSSVGKIKTTNPNETCLSLNVITLDPARQHLTGRVLAERVVGGGLSVYQRHAIVYRRRIGWMNKEFTK